MMFFKASILALVAHLAHAAINIEQPTDVRFSSPLTINWTADNSDPQLFTIELSNEVFRNDLAIGNNILTALQTAVVNIGVVPVRDGYTISFVDVSNITNVYARTAPFSIAAPDNVTTTASSSSSAATASGSSATGSGALTTSTPRPSTTGFGSTLTNSANTGTTTGASSAGASGSSSSTANPSGFNGAASSFGTGSYAAMILSGIAGAALIAL